LIDPARLNIQWNSETFTNSVKVNLYLIKIDPRRGKSRGDFTGSAKKLRKNKFLLAVCLANKVVVLMTGTASLATNKITLRQVNYSNVKILAIDTKTIDLDRAYIRYY
jgi:hypothetical protein